MKSKLKGFVVNEYVFGIPEVEAMIQRDGASGIGKLVSVCVRLMKLYHCIGTVDDIPDMARKVRVRGYALENWIRTCGVFTLIDNGRMFYFSYLRKILGEPPCVSEDEIEFVKENGNRYTAYLREIIRNYNKNKGTAENEISQLSQQCDNNVASENEVRCISNESQKLQSSDNVEVKSSPIDISDININSYSNITNIMSNSYSNTSSSQEPSLVAADAESSFKIFEAKIFNSVRWRKSTSEALGVNLTDDDAAHYFISWMYNYCVSKGKLRDANDTSWVLSYASNLLMKGMRTRKCFDVEYARFVARREEAKKARAKVVRKGDNDECCGTFEQIVNGVRYGLGHQPLPNDAPYQTEPGTRWSYIKHRWVKTECWDEKREMDFYRRSKCGEVMTVGQIILNKILPALIVHKGRGNSGDGDAPRVSVNN